MVDILFEAMLDLLSTLRKAITTLIKWVLSVLDYLGIVFTYLATLLITLMIVSTYLKGDLMCPIVGCIIVTTLIYVNKSLKGGGK